MSTPASICKECERRTTELDGYCARCFYEEIEPQNAAPPWFTIAVQHVKAGIEAANFACCRQKNEKSTRLELWSAINSMPCLGDMRQPFKIMNVMMGGAESIPDALLVSGGQKIAVELKWLNARKNRSAEIQRGIGQSICYSGGIGQGGIEYDAFILIAIDKAEAERRVARVEWFRFQDSRPRWFWFAWLRGTAP